MPWSKKDQVAGTSVQSVETRAMQSARDDPQRVLQAPEQAQRMAAKNVAVMRTAAIVAVGGLVLAVVHAVEGNHH